MPGISPLLHFLRFLIRWGPYECDNERPLCVQEQGRMPCCIPIPMVHLIASFCFHYIIRILQDNDCYVDGMTETFVRSSEHT